MTTRPDDDQLPQDTSPPEPLLGPKASRPRPLTQQALSCASWLAGHKALVAVLQLFTIAVLARRLEPADFGLVALVQVMLSGLLAAGYGGISTYVVCELRDRPTERTDAAFWVGTLMSAAGIALFVALIPLMKWMSPHPLTVPVAFAAVAAIVLSQLRAVPEGLLKRGLKYDALVIRDAGFDTAGCVLQVVLAVTGFGIWSLVLPNVVVQAFRLIVTYRMARWRPSANLGRAYWSHVARYSGNMAGTNVLGLVANEGDTLLVGTFLGNASLGVYNAAWRLANLPGRYVSGLVSELAAPVFARVADDPPRFNNAYIRTVKVIGAVSFPALIGLFVFADDVIALVYGGKWLGAVLPLRIFIAFTLQRVVMAPIGALVYVKGRPEVAFRFNLGFVPFYLLAIGIGARWGLVGVAAGVTVSRILGGLIWYRLASRAASVSSTGILRNLGRLMTLSVAAAGTVLIVSQIVAGLGPPQVRLPLLAALGASVYAVLLWIFERALVVEWVSACRPLWSRPLSMLRSYVSS